MLSVHHIYRLGFRFVSATAGCDQSVPPGQVGLAGMFQTEGEL